MNIESNQLVPSGGPRLPDRPFTGLIDDVGADDQSGFDFGKLWVAIRRNWLLIVGIVGAALLIGLAATMLATPRYTAVSSVQVDQQADRVLETQDVQPVGSYLDADRYLKTQTDVLRSRTMAIRVAQALNLFSDGRFLVAMGEDPPTGRDQASIRAARERTINVIRANLRVTLPQDSRIISVAFESPDPRLAARIVNSYAKEFIESNLQRKYESSTAARNFLSRQITGAKARLEQSERALTAYARDAGLINTSDASSSVGQAPRSITTASLIQLNQAANEARASRIAAEQKWRSISGAPAMSIPEVLGNPAIQALLSQRAKAQSDLLEERTRHLESHPTVQQMQAQVNELNRQIDTLAGSVRSSVREEYESAALREQSLLGQVNSFKTATLNEQDRSVRYNILAREADTNRTLYDGLLQRYKEVSAAAGVNSNNISVIDEADPPMVPSSPKLLVNMALALMAGVMISAIVVFMREQLDDAIRAPHDIEEKLGLPLLGVIPQVENEDVMAQLVEPRSSIAEAYHALRTSLLYATPEGLPRTLMVSSSQASEGKSTTSFAVASGLARLGKEVVLVDVDLRRPSLHRVMGTNNDAGLTDLLTSHDDFETVIMPTGIDRLAFIPSGRIPPSPTELLGSSRMQEVLSQLAEAFDVVVLDAPPVLGLADAPVLAALAQGTIFVVEANRGRRGATKTALRRLQASHGFLLGAVLTKFDARKNGAYGYYGYDYYQYGNTAGDRKKALAAV